MKRKLNILVTTPYPLFPTDSGGKIYALSTIEPLAELHNYHLLAHLNREEKSQFDTNRDILMQDYGRVFKSIHFVDRPPIPYEFGSRVKVLMHLIRHGLRGLPLMDLSYYSREAMQSARQLIRKHSIDLVEMHHLHTAFYRKATSQVPAILFNHNIESDLWPYWPLQVGTTLGKQIWNLFGTVSRRNAHAIEIQNALNFSAKFFISSLDLSRVDQTACPTILLPMSVQMNYSVKKFNKDKCIILWIGGFFWHPNVDAMLWFFREIWPLIVRAGVKPIEMHVVGTDPPEEIRQFHDGRNIFIHGYVRDADEFRARADVFVVPLRHGGGVRIKIVEALNAGIPVVTTPKGCEGLPVRDGTDLSVAETAEDFARQVWLLASSIELQQRRSENARRYCAENHSRDYVVKTRQELYEKIIGLNYKMLRKA